MYYYYYYEINNNNHLYSQLPFFPLSHFYAV